MSPLPSMRLASLPALALVVALALGACSDPGTGPAEDAAAGSPAATSSEPISAAVVGSLADLQTLSQLTVTLTAQKNPALCLLDRGYYKLRVFTHAGIPFYPTSSQSAEWVYFRANFYEKSGSFNPERWLGSSDWFATALSSGQTSSTSWYHIGSTGSQWGSWQTDMIVAADYGANFRVTYEYWWNQNGTWVSSQVASPAYIAGSGSPFTALASSCLLGYPTSGQTLAAQNNTGVILYGLRNLPTFP